VEYNRNLSESIAILGIKTPTSQGVGEQLSAAIHAGRYRRLVAVIQVGAFGASATVDATFKASSTSGGTYTAVPGAAITQMLAAGGNDKVVIIELKAETLKALGVGPYVKLSVTVGTAATLTAAVVYGVVDRYEPASDNNVANVTQTVVA
jgi:hypothetical protein